MTIRFIPAEGGADGENRFSRQDCNAVKGFLGHGGTFISEFLENLGRKFRSLQLLEQEYVWSLRLEPSRDGIQSGSNRIHVPASDSDVLSPLIFLRVGHVRGRCLDERPL